MDAVGDKARTNFVGFFRQLMFDAAWLISSAATGPHVTTQSSERCRRGKKSNNYRNWK